MISLIERHMEKRQLKPGEVSPKQIAIIIAVVLDQWSGRMTARRLARTAGA